MYLECACNATNFRFLWVHTVRVDRLIPLFPISPEDIFALPRTPQMAVGWRGERHLPNSFHLDFSP
jgi:hypothetical protein